MKAFENATNCTGTDPDAYFTDDTGTYRDTLLLKRICGDCPAKTECLDYALQHEVMGYWGNTTEYQRSRLRRQLNIIARPLHLDYNQE